MDAIEFRRILMGNGVIVICLAAGYYLLKKAGSATGTEEHERMRGCG